MQCALYCVTGVLIRESRRRFEPQTLTGRRPCENRRGGREGGRDTATSQGSLEPPEAGRGHPSLEPPEGAQRCRGPDFRLVPCRAVRKYISAVLSTPPHFVLMCHGSQRKLRHHLKAPGSCSLLEVQVPEGLCPYHSPLSSACGAGCGLHIRRLFTASLLLLSSTQ